MLVVNKTPAVWSGRVVGSVITLRDRTDLQAISGELDSAQGPGRHAARAEPRGRQPAAHGGVADRDGPPRRRRRVRHPGARARPAADRPRGEPPSTNPCWPPCCSASPPRRRNGGSTSPSTPGSGHRLEFDPQDLVTMVGNLIDNAMDAAGEIEAGPEGGGVLRSGGTSAPAAGGGLRPGLAAEQRSQVFTRGWSTKPGPTGSVGASGSRWSTEVVRGSAGGSRSVRRGWVEPSSRSTSRPRP